MNAAASIRLREIACALHSEGDTALEAVLTEQDASLFASAPPSTAQIIEGRLVFPDLASRNRVVAEAKFAAFRMLDEQSATTLFEMALALWENEITASDRASGRFLALYAAEADIFVAAAEVLGTTRVWNVLHVLEGTFPYLTAWPIDSVVSFCERQHPLTQGDLMAGSLYEKMATHLERDSVAAAGIFAHLRAGFSGASGGLYSVASEVLMKLHPQETFEQVCADARSRGELAAQATWHLGQLVRKALVPDDLHPKLEAVLTENSPSDDRMIARAAKHALAEACTELSLGCELFTGLVEQGDQDAVYAAVDTIWFRSDVLQLPFAATWLQAIALHLSPTAVGAVRHFDALLYRLMHHNDEMVGEYLTAWIAAKGGEENFSLTDLLPSTMSKLNDKRELTGRLLVTWLCDERPQVAEAAGDLLGFLRLHRFDAALDMDLVATLETSAFVFFLKRLLAHAIDEGQLLGLLRGLLDERFVQLHGKPVLVELFGNFAGMDYPNATLECLREAEASAKDDAVRELCRSAIRVIEDHLNALRRLPPFDEMRPSARLLQQHERAQAEKMANSQRETDKKSFIRQIATRIPMKAGKSCFSHFQGSYGEPRELMSFTHSVTMPNRWAFDAIGYEMERFAFMQGGKETS